jgi:hypothetical protein
MTNYQIENMGVDSDCLTDYTMENSRAFSG